VRRLPAAFLPLVHRHAEAEDTGAEVTSEFAYMASEELARAVLTKAASEASAELVSKVLPEVTWRAFAEVTLAMERAFAEATLASERAFTEVTLQFYSSQKAKTRIIVISNEAKTMEFNLLASTKQASIAIAAALVLSMPLAPTFSASAPSNTAPQNQAAPAFGSGDLVRLRSGGPLMTVKGIKGNQVDCFWTDGIGQMNADSFPIDVLRKE
jgi:uncharacterized protein YodC (DUF2158 family)